VPEKLDSATILVVDDEHALRQLLVRQLRNAGYNVVEAGYGLEALEVARSSSEPIDLVLSDIVMPGMIGTELAEQLTAEHPGIRVVLMTAHAVVPAASTGHIHRNFAVLSKPFEGRKLLAIVEHVLEETAESDSI
jgi:two-component system, cell cycle sensor histidine kinase and response regulator CckA